VIFSSFATNLVTPDALGEMDVFVRDLASGVTTRVSVNSGGREANGWSSGRDISADGSEVLFWSLATNLVPGDTNGVGDFFLRDLRTGITERVNLGANGVEANGNTDGGTLSADGRFVLFSSIATNLVTGDTNGKEDAFLRDLQAGTTIRVSLTANGTESTGHSGGGGLSADGRYVVLNSLASDLVPGDVNGYEDCFLLDRRTGGLELVSLAYDGAQGNYGGGGGSVSNDGRFVLFYSMSTNLVPGGEDNFGGNFVRDRGPTVETFCFGDGTRTPCPCSNDGGRGRGCDNSEHTGGAELRSSGRSSLGRDSLVLVTDGVRANAPCVVIRVPRRGSARLRGRASLPRGAPTRLFLENAVGTSSSCRGSERDRSRSVRRARSAHPPGFLALLSGVLPRRGLLLLPGTRGERLERLEMASPSSGITDGGDLAEPGRARVCRSRLRKFDPSPSPGNPDRGEFP
jgi:Tol biopolymer transport system component